MKNKRKRTRNGIWLTSQNTFRIFSFFPNFELYGIKTRIQLRAPRRNTDPCLLNFPRNTKTWQKHLFHFRYHKPVKRWCLSHSPPFHLFKISLYDVSKSTKALFNALLPSVGPTTRPRIIYEMSDTSSQEDEKRNIQKLWFDVEKKTLF